PSREGMQDTGAVVALPGLRRRLEARRGGRSRLRHRRNVTVPRVKRGSKRRERRKKLLGLAKGYFLNKGKLYRAAKEAVDRAGNFAYAGRRRKKRDFRRLWIIR